MGERDFARFEFKMRFERISHISQGPRTSQDLDTAEIRIVSALGMMANGNKCPARLTN